MRIVSQRTLKTFAERHPDARAALGRWIATTTRASWASSADVVGAMATAKALNGERVRFEVAGGAYRPVVAFDFQRQIAYIKFVGTHAAYDRIDALTLSHR